MLKTQITREELDRLGEDIRQHIDLYTAERGLEYQQKGLVYNTEIIPGRAITSKVQGPVAYSVKLDLDFFGLSECSCPFEGHCEHMAAVFFYAYSAHSRPDYFVKEWRKKQAGPPPQERQRTSRLHRITSLQAASQPDSGALKENAAPSEWIEHLDREFLTFTERHNRYQYDLDEYYAAAVQTAIRPAAWWGSVPRKLMELYANIRILDKMEQDCAEGGTQQSHHLYAYRNAAEMFERSIMEVAAELDVKRTRQGWSDHLQELGVFVSRALANPEPSMFADWLYIYQALWSGPLYSEDWAAREIEVLDRTIHASASRPDTDGEMLARAHFYIMEGNDDLARSLMKRSAGFHPRKTRFYISELKRTEQWERLWRWMLWLLPQCKKTDEELFRSFCSYASEATKHLGLEEQWMHSLRSLLPASYPVYTDFLIKSGRYREWVDYHVSERVSVSDLYLADIRTIESHDPSILFPIYHQTVERCVLQKNRTAYKEAIRQLKKLETLYQQAGHTERYEAYLARLSAHFGRLRAFQEELRKGRLLR